MPEGPEVKLISEGLNARLQDKQLIDIEILSGRYVRHGPPSGFEIFKAKLPLFCLHVAVKGKFIYINFDDPHSPERTTQIWNTLGMSGLWSDSIDTHARLKLQLEDGNVYFVDQRNYGTLKFNMAPSETANKLNSLGIDFLQSSIVPSSGLSIHTFQKKKNLGRTLAQILMDQSNYAGVGNYIKAEALYRARLSPHRMGSSMSNDDIHRLHWCINDVIRGSYEAQGVTLSNYKTMDGEKGNFKRVVYGRSHDPDGNPVIQEETLDRRTTHWVPSVQR